jgi:hypothetical protein
MNSSSHRQPRRRLRVAAGFVLMFATLSGIAAAVEFDERVKAPLMKDGAALRTQAQSYSARFATLRESGPEELITNQVLAGERFDLSWQIQQAIDVHRPVGDLSAVGFVDRGDGSYSVDLLAFPQWDVPDRHLSTLLPQMNWDAVSRQLISRGMTPDESAKLGQYFATHDLNAMTAAKTLPLSVGFSRVVRKFDKLKRPVPEALVLSYVYQRARAADEATRQWMADLLQSVGAHGGRIVLSSLAEGESKSVWSPSDQSAGIADILATVRKTNFEELATAEAQGAAP